MLAPAASRRRLLLAASSAAALLFCASLLAVLRPHAAASSQLSATRFFGRVSPDLARLMSEGNDSQEDSAAPPPSSSSSSSNFYSDVSRTLGRLMAKRGVLAEDAAELSDASPALRVPVAVPQQLPYDEAVTLGTPISTGEFQRAVAAVRRARHIGPEVQLCHACVRAAAAAAKAKAAAAAAAAKAKAAAAKATAAADAQNRLEKAAEEKLRTLRRKQRADAAAAAAELARQRSLIARLQVGRPHPSHTHPHPRFSSHAARAGRRQLPPLRAAARESQPLARVASTLAKLLTCVCAFQMQDALRQARAQAQLQQLRDAAAVARASRQLKTGQRFEQRRLRGASAVE
jgi:hypothetical protein